MSAVVVVMIEVMVVVGVAVIMSVVVEVEPMIVYVRLCLLTSDYGP